MILVRYMTMAPTVKATTTDSRIPDIIARAFPELIKSPISFVPSGNPISLMIEIPTAAPSNSNTIETVVEVERPNVLNISSRITSVIITARNMIMISEKKNIWG